MSIGDVEDSEVMALLTSTCRVLGITPASAKYFDEPIAVTNLRDKAIAIDWP